KVTAASVAPHLGDDAPPAFLAYGVQDSLVAPATQGIPLTRAWADAREVSGRTPINTQDVELEQALCGHNMEAANLDMTAMEAGIASVRANPSSTTPPARAARGRPVTAPPLH